MLTQIRKIFSGVLGFALIGLLVIAFAAWGVADMFDMVGRGSVAKVGSQKIPTNEFRFRLAQQMDQISRELNEPLTIEQARTFGVDQQVLGRMITLATLNEATDELGLDISDDYIRGEIINDPSFAGPGGGFDTPTFRRLLALNGLTEKVFVRDRRNNKTREQMLGAISYATVFPAKLNEIIYTHSLETRKVEYILIQPDMAGVIGDPSEDELRTLYQQVPNIFTEPERRTATILNLSPSNLIDTITITEDELREEYEILQDDYINAETREVNQLVLTDEIEAQKAKDILASGKEFEDVAKALSQKISDTDLGEVARGDFIAEELADLAFSLEEGQTSGIVDGPLGKVVMKVRKINAQTSQSFEDIKEEIRQKLAQEKAEDDLVVLSENIYDSLSGGSSLEALSEESNLELLRVENISRDGALENGSVIDVIGKKEKVMSRIFESDMGQEASAVELEDGSLLWIRVDGIMPERVSPFEDVREKATQQWKSRERRALLEGLAEHIVSEGNKGKKFSTLAGEVGKSPITSPAVNRQTDDETFSRQAVRKLFVAEEGAFTWSQVGFGESLIVMRVAEIVRPDLDNEIMLSAFMSSASQSVNDAVLTQLIRDFQNEFGVSVDNQTLEAQLGNFQQ